MCVLFILICVLDCCNFASSFQSPDYFQLQKLLVNTDSSQTYSEQENILIPIKRHVEEYWKSGCYRCPCYCTRQLYTQWHLITVNRNAAPKQIYVYKELVYLWACQR